MHFNKKASLELSIRAIVIIVMAMTILGLGLGFTKKIFGDIGGLSGSTFDRLSDQLQSDLVDSDQKLVFSQTKITIGRGKSLLLGWGIKNENAGALDYWVEFTPSRCPEEVDSSGVVVTPSAAVCAALKTSDDLNTKWFTFKYNKDGDANGPFYLLDAADQHIKRVDLTVPKGSDVKPGLYLISLTVYDGNGRVDNTYASTDLFITVG